MADIKITALTALAVAPDSLDVIAIVDVSDLSQAPSGTTKHITIADLAFLSVGDNISLLNNNSGYITSSDFSNGGELATADRDLGNTDAFGLSFITSGVGRINILATGEVGIGVTPTETLDVLGTFKLVDASQGLGKLLTSDAAGLATWQDLAAGVGGIYGGSGSLSAATTVTQASNDLTFSTTGNANALVIDGATGNIGIGRTFSTSYDLAVGTQGLFVQGQSVVSGGAFTVGGNSLFVHATNDRVGIGTLLPFTGIDASGLYIETGNSSSSAMVVVSQKAGQTQRYAGILLEDFTAGQSWHIKNRIGGNNFSIGEGIEVNDATAFLIEATTNNVGIGTATPTEKLEVVGSIKASTHYKVGANQVVGAQGASVADATDAATAITQLNALISRMETHGLIATV